MSFGIFPVKIENQLIANIFHIPNFYQSQNTMYLLVLEQKKYVSSFNMPMLTSFLSIVTHDIPNKKE